jgi:hypothetical protein
MSTKTTFKRIALVAVAALGFGTLSVAPSSADILQAGFRTLAFQSPTATATTGVETKAVLQLAGSCVEHDTNGNTVSAYATLQIDVAPAGTNRVMNSVSSDAGTPTGYTNTNSVTTAGTPQSWNGYRNMAQIDCVASTSAMVGFATVKFTPDVAGTYVIVAVPLGATTGAATWTVVASAPAAISAAGSTVLIAGSTTTPTTTTDAAAVTGSRSLTAPVAANITVVAGNSTTADTSVAGTLSATVSGSGLVSWTNSRAAAARSVAAGAAGKTGTLYVFSDGTSGVGTITISSGSTALATKTVTFYGSVASLTVTAMAKSVVDTAEGAAATDTDAFVGVVSAKDAAGVTVPIAAADFTVSSATERTAQAVTAAAAVEGVAAATYNGVAITATSVVLAVDPTATKTGAKTLTLTHTATTVATTFSFTVALAAATTVAVTNDQASPVPGQKITYTVTAKDAGGNAIPDGSAVAVAVTTSLSQSATLPTTLAFANGVGTFSLFAPVTPGIQTVTVTMNTIAGSTTSDVADLTAPAVDAAAEAIDAANAATDAANAAAEAADAATAAAQDAADAVAALSTQVAEMIDALKKQITALTNLVIKIQKKVKA